MWKHRDTVTYVVYAWFPVWLKEQKKLAWLQQVNKTIETQVRRQFEVPEYRTLTTYSEVITVTIEPDLTQETKAQLERLVRELGVADFMKSEHAYDCWLVHEERHGQQVITRGIPGKVPYQVFSPRNITKDDKIVVLDPNTHAYWNAYSHNANALVIWEDACT